MEPLGPIVSLPLGFAFLTIIGCVVLAVIGALLWKTMYHEPDDYVDYDKRPEFKMKDL